MKICILIPAYQEEGRIGKVVEEARRFGDVVIIDDGSQDRTCDEAQSHGATVIRHSENQGKGVAIRTGLDHFLKGTWEAVILMDGDGQHNPREIPRFIEAARDESILMVIGNRMGETLKMPAIRRATNWLMSKILSLFVGVAVPDSQCGFRLLKRALVEKINLKSKRFDVESEILIEAGRFTKGIQSISITSIYQGQKSKIRPVRDTVRFLKLMLRSFFEKSKIKNQRSCRNY